MPLKNRYIDLIEQTFYFPRHGFSVVDNNLQFHGIPLMELVEKYGSPLKITYLPKISSQIQKAKSLFKTAIEKNEYSGKYVYCYCTKSSHFKFVMDEAFNNDIHIETSSAYDINIIRNLFERGKLKKQSYIICNGFKRETYIKNIADLVDEGFNNVVCVFDNKEEAEDLSKAINKPCNVGIRMAITEDPNFVVYTSRLGVRFSEVVDFYTQSIKTNPNFRLKMLHFFINTGIRDTTYYWSELAKCVEKYCDLKEVCPELDSLDIGGGLPIYNSLGMEYDYEYMINEIVVTIKSICDSRNIEVPDIFTEFGSFTVGESGAIIYSVLGQKQQNDTENWYMIDSSFITTLPDTWGIGQKFILLALNQWDKPYLRINLGGITCDGMDYYNSEMQINQVFMPKIGPTEKLYLGFFHTGAYQESIGGYGGIQHCLVPAPKHIIINRDMDGSLTYQQFAPEQSAESMMKILGY